MSFVPERDVRLIARTRETTPRDVENERSLARGRCRPAGHWPGRISNVEVHYAETVKGLPGSGSANPPEGR